MKVSYDLNDKDGFKVFNDSMGVYAFKDSILKNRKLKYMNYIVLISIKIAVLSTILGVVIGLCYAFFCTLSVILLVIGIILFMYTIMNVFYPLILNDASPIPDKGNFVVDEKGITFELDYDLNMTIGWSHLKGIIIGKHSINFITDYSYYFYLGKKYKKEIVDAVKKYNKSLTIVSK